MSTPNTDPIVRHLVQGLEKIVALKDTKRCKDPMEEIMGEPGEDADGFRPIHPRMKRGLKIASDMAQEILDNIPKTP